MAHRAAHTEVGYLALIRGNVNFRRLWLGSIVSLLGDWFNTIALYTIVERLTGSPFALGLVFITKMLPFALASPLAGLITDRFNRRRLMIVCDAIRAVIVLGFLLVRTPGDLWLLYTLITLQVVLGAVFIPARNASVPNITTPRELLTANALMAATWSTLLAVGAALGGFATEWLGEGAVFIIDSATYVASSLFLWKTVIPQNTAPVRAGPLVRTALADIADGWRHMHIDPRIGRIALAKATWALGGGALVFMLTLLGSRLMPEAPAVAIGVLFSMRGLGTGIGPILGRALFKDERRWPTVLGWCVVLSGVFYLGVGSMPWSLGILAVGALVTLAHTPSGANWVLSTVLLQQRTADAFRGRVFATEWLLVTLADTLAIGTASLLLESGLVSLRGAFLGFAALQIVSGLLWLLLVVPRERRDEARVGA